MKQLRTRLKNPSTPKERCDEAKRRRWLLAIAREVGRQSLSVSELSRRSGVRRATVSEAMAGKRAARMGTLHRLWVGLGFTGSDPEPGEEVLVQGSLDNRTGLP